MKDCARNVDELVEGEGAFFSFPETRLVIAIRVVVGFKAAGD